MLHEKRGEGSGDVRPQQSHRASESDAGRCGHTGPAALEVVRYPPRTWTLGASPSFQRNRTRCQSPGR